MQCHVQGRSLYYEVKYGTVLLQFTRFYRAFGELGDGGDAPEIWWEKMWLLPIVWGERMEAVNKVRQGCVEMGSINAFFPEGSEC